MLLLKFYFSGAVFVGLAYCATLDGLTVQTTGGSVRGQQLLTVEQKRPLYAFRGIPYAEPPVGARRFEPAVPKNSWTGVLDALEDKPSCIQGSEPVEGSEDCLHINVYTPTLPSASCQLLPTLVWIFGGGFEGGDSSYELYGPDHLSEQDVVVVTFNYRLGLLGFLSTGDTVAPGNNGLKDQLLALKWVQNNIKSFCGNPNQITLGGQSAGAASVAYHMQSPKSKGLFQRALLSSGVSINPWAFSRRVPEIVTSVAQTLGVDTSSSRAILDGLKSLDVTLLQQNASSTITNAFLSGNPTDGFAIGPVSEPNHSDAFFSGKSHQILESGQYNQVPALVGFNSQEGSYEISLALRLLLVLFDLNPKLLLPADLNVPSNQEATATQNLKSYYFGWLPITLSEKELLRFLSHDQFVRGIREFSRLVNKRSQTFLYRFSYEGGLWGYHNRTTSGVTHSEELGYYWVSKHEPLRPHDLVIRSRMITLLTNFIKYGNPTPNRDSLLQNVNWDSLGTSLNYLDIGDNLVLTQSPENTDMNYWDSFFAQYGHPPYGTY